jgi:hypothetical protein
VGGPAAVVAVAVAQEMGVPAIDLNSMGMDLNAALGTDSSTAWLRSSA